VLICVEDDLKCPLEVVYAITDEAIINNIRLKTDDISEEGNEEDE
jgi:hypothetical protein